MIKRNRFVVIMIGLVILLGVTMSLYTKKNMPTASAAELPQNFSPPTPYATALPGAAAQVLQKFAHTTIITQVVQGVEFSAANFRVVEDQLRVDVCFQLPTSEDWLIYNAIARVGDTEILYSESYAIETSRTLENGQKQTISYPSESTGVTVLKAMEEDIKGQPDYRCDTISFQLEKDMVVSNATIVLGAIVMSEREGHGCETYLENVQSILDAENTGIRLDCVKQEGGEFTSIAEKPASMSDEEAQRWISEAKRRVSTIEGPWIFEGKIE